MANITHQLLFMLGAKVDSTFGSSFTTAQRAIAEMQKKIRDFDSGVSSVKKVSQSIATLTEKLAAATVEYTELTAKEDASGAEKDELKAKIKSLEEALTGEREKLAGVIEKMTDTRTAEERMADAAKEDEAAFQALIEQVKASGAEGERYAQILTEMRAKTEALKKEQEEIANRANRLDAVTQAFSAMGIAASQALTYVEAIKEKIDAVIETSSAFEYTISAVEAVSGATASEVEQLSDMAKEMGRTTVFTAQECAEAMETQALAGWDVEDMLSGLPAVIKLAAAADEDLADMTSIVSDALHAFGLEGEAATTKFADVLTKAATSANTNVSLIGESLSYVETTAGNLGYSIEDVSTVLAQMANNALKGSTSGTALNTMLTRMSGANATAAKEMERLNISMYDETEQAKPLLEFINELRDAFSGMTEQEAQISAYKLAGQRGMRGLLSLVNSSDEAWQELTEQVAAYAGAASSIADIRLDNYTGQVKLLQSAWNDLQINAGETLLPAYTAGAEVLTDIVTKLDEVASENTTLTAGVMGGITAVTYEAQGFFSLMEKISMSMMGINQMAQVMERFGEANKFVSWLPKLGKVTGVATAIIALTAAIGNAAYSAYNADTTFDELTQSLEDMEAQAEAADAAYEESISGYETQRAEAEKLITSLDGLLAAELAHGGQEEFIRAKVDELNAALPGLGLSYTGVGTQISMTTDEIRAFNSAMSQDEWQTKKERLAELKSEMEGYQKAVDELNRKNAEKLAGDTNYSIWAGNPEMAGSMGLTGLKSKGAYVEYTQDMTEAQEALNKATEEYNELQAEVSTEIQRKMADIGVTGMDEEAFATTEEALKSLAEAYYTAYDAALTSVREQYSLFDEVEEITAASTEKLRENMLAQGQVWDDYAANLQTLQGLGFDLSTLNLGADTESISLVMGLVADYNQTLEDTGGDADAAKAKVQEFFDAFSELGGKENDVAAILGTTSESYQQAVQACSDAIGTLPTAAQLKAIGEEAFGGYLESIGAGGTNAKGAMETAGEDAVQALIDAMTAKQGAVDTASGEIADALPEAYSAAASYDIMYTRALSSTNGITAGLNAGLANVRSAVASINRTLSSIGSTTVTGITINNPAGWLPQGGFASGTDYAPEGWAWVGEDGPELMYMQGGEKVIDNTSSMRIVNNMDGPQAVKAAPALAAVPAAGGGTTMQVTYAPVISMGAAAGAADVRQVLERDKESLKDFLDDWAEEREADRRRRSR